jgi:predicted RNA-binding Zn ribbon-like protein
MPTMGEPETKPAPDNLALIQLLVNSVELPDGEDELGAREAASAWLAKQGFAVSRPLAEDDRRRLIEVREGLRSLLLAHTGEPVDAGVAALLMHHLNEGGLNAVISTEGARLAPADRGVNGLFALILAGIVEATVAGTWERLKVCGDDTCRWAFYDRSKNGRGAWCSMRSCGSRHKARTYRERRRVEARVTA